MKIPIVVLISANAEWQAVLECVDPVSLPKNPYSEHFFTEVGGKTAVFMHGGWGKVSAAATAEYAISTWHPDLLVNLGTCGGLEGAAVRGETLLVNETVIYDIYERMSDPAEAIEHYRTLIDLSFIHSPYPQPVHVARLASADQDIDPEMVGELRKRYQVSAADWESASIAWVASRHALPCLILRTVSDIVSSSGGEIYADDAAGFAERSREIMEKLLVLLPNWIQISFFKV